MYQLAIANSELLHFLEVASQPLLLLALLYVLLLKRSAYRTHSREISELKQQFSETLLRTQLEVQEKVLGDIARELHANFSNLLSLITINLSESLSKCPPEMREELLETKTIARQLLSELRETGISLNTDHIQHIGFRRAMENELNRFGRGGRYRVRFSVAGEPYRLPPDHELILFRLCQEILNNIVKYAEAKSVDVGLDYSPALFTLQIADDGIGFDVPAAIGESADKNSTGLLNIRKRAQLINAGVEIRSRQGAGTSFVINIPQREILN